MECQTCLENGFFAAVLMMASVHGLLLVLILLFAKRLRSKANRYLALSLFGMFVILGYESAYWLGGEEVIPTWIDWLPIYIRTTIPAGIYYFVLYLIRPNHQLKTIEKTGFLAMGIEVLLHLAGVFVKSFYQDGTSREIIYDYLTLGGWCLSLVTWAILMPLAFQQVNQYQKSLYEHYSTADHKSLAWLRGYLLAATIIVGISLVSFVQYALQDWEGSTVSFAIVSVGMVLLLFWIGYFVILRYTWFEIVVVAEPVPKGNAQEGKLSSKTDAYYQNLINLMEQDRLFENVDLTLESLAEHLAISSGYLSQIIREKEQKTFYQFVNHYRVEAVKSKLLNREFEKYTIMGIAEDCGFNSKSTFNAVFKKFTGQTPSAFKKANQAAKDQ